MGHVINCLLSEQPTYGRHIFYKSFVGSWLWHSIVGLSYIFMFTMHRWETHCCHIQFGVAMGGHICSL